MRVQRIGATRFVRFGQPWPSPFRRMLWRLSRNHGDLMLSLGRIVLASLPRLCASIARMAAEAERDHTLDALRCAATDGEGS